jgi:hypothetical protein
VVVGRLGRDWSKDIKLQLDRRVKFKRSLYNMVTVVNNILFFKNASSGVKCSHHKNDNCEIC